MHPINNDVTLSEYTDLSDDDDESELGGAERIDAVHISTEIFPS